MARTNWLDENNELPLFDEHVKKLEHFAASLADGRVDREELERQRANLVEAIKVVEGDLPDETHEKVTRLLMELTAYNVMTVLHEMAVERLRRRFGS